MPDQAGQDRQECMVYAQLLIVLVLTFALSGFK
jgi:hypothetical protein